MRTRVIVGLTLAAVLIGLLLLDAYLAAQRAPTAAGAGAELDLGAWLCNGAISTAVVLVLTLRAVHELVSLARLRGYRPFGRSAHFFAAVLVIAPWVSNNLSPVTGGYDESLGMLWLAIALGFSFLLQAVLYRTQNAMENIAITLFLIVYAGGLAGFMTKLRMEVGGPTGLILLLFSVFLVKMTDTGAFFTGSLVGRNKMVPWLSPKKTWEGLVGGLVTTVLLAVLLGGWLQAAGWVTLLRPAVPHAVAMVFLGLMLGVASAAGDLAASVLKRDAAVKDSGQAFPGLGGVLDVFDSPLLSAPLAWLFWTRLFHV